MKLIAETQEPCKASGHQVRVKWFLADAGDLPEEVRKAVIEPVRGVTG